MSAPQIATAPSTSYRDLYTQQASSSSSRSFSAARPYYDSARYASSSSSTANGYGQQSWSANNNPRSGVQPTPSSSKFTSQPAGRPVYSRPVVNDDGEVTDDSSLYSNDTVTSAQFYSNVLKSGVDSRANNISTQWSNNPHAPYPASVPPNFENDEPYRDSWQTASEAGTRPDSDVEPFAFRAYETPRVPLPIVVVSSPRSSTVPDNDAYDEDDSCYPEPPLVPTIKAGRTPSVIPANLNFSRPNLPPIVPAADVHKQRVLERNAHRDRSPSKMSSSPNSSTFSFGHGPSSPNSVASSSGKGSSTLMSSPMNPGPSRSPSYSQLSPRSQSSDPYSSNPNTPSASSPSLSPSVSTPKTFNSIPSRPDLGRSHTPAESVYSTYSYYELSPSPKQTTFPSGVSGPAPPDQQLTGSLQRNDGRNTSSSRLGHQQGAAQPGTPEEYVQLGISHHEANRLQESAYCFEKSATENGGCCVGMLMWGLSLRHGWGCAKDEPKAFRWLKRAAEHAVVDLQAAKEGKDVIKTELVLAVYEVGQSFFQGWGVERDQKMAVSYFETAAHLGDPDAQQDLAFCLANGKGCKKDRKAAAKWYRAAAAQGASTIGLAWIYKPKYMD